MEANTQGRRPTGPGAYVYRGKHVERIVLVWETYGPVVTYAAAWIADGERRITTTGAMPGDFVPLAKPVAAPEPDWSSAPEWATGHQYGASGDGIWTAPGRSELSGLKLPLGCDWRTTLKRRPEGDNALS